MIIQCPSCRTRYHYDEGRFAGLPAKRIRCTKCSGVFEIHNPAVTAPPEGFQPDETGPLNAPLLGSDDFSLDSTVMASGPRKKPVSVLPAGGPFPVAPPTPFRPAPPKGPETGSQPAPPTVGDGTRRLRLPEGERLSVACIAGPDAGKVFPIERPRVVIGRAGSDVLLTDGECSRHHAAIEVEGDRATLLDLGSTNGTYVGDRRVAESELGNRSEFDVGASTLMFLRTTADETS